MENEPLQRTVCFGSLTANLSVKFVFIFQEPEPRALEEFWDTLRDRARAMLFVQFVLAWYEAYLDGCNEQNPEVTRSSAKSSHSVE